MPTHKGVGDKDGPSYVVAELRSALRIGADAARVVSGSIGNGARAPAIFHQTLSAAVSLGDIGHGHD